MPDFRFDRISKLARGVKAILNPEDVPRVAAAPGVEQAEDLKNARKGMSERRKTLRGGSLLGHRDRRSRAKGESSLR